MPHFGDGQYHIGDLNPLERASRRVWRSRRTWAMPSAFGYQAMHIWGHILNRHFWAMHVKANIINTCLSHFIS